MNTRAERALRHQAEPSKGHALKRNRRSVVAPYELGGQLTLSRQIKDHPACACASAGATFIALLCGDQVSASMALP